MSFENEKLRELIGRSALTTSQYDWANDPVMRELWSHLAGACVAHNISLNDLEPYDGNFTGTIFEGRGI